MSVVPQVRISFKVGGRALEGIVSHPQGVAGPVPAALLCHPEPQLGGTMESAVVKALAWALNSRGFLVLRFNYRGVGESEGTFSMGVGELEDALAALKVLRAWPGADGRRVGVVGYSFGAGIAVRMALRARAVRACAAVSPPLTLPPVALHGVQGLDSFRRPLLFLIGERDGLTSPAALRVWVEGLGNPSLRLLVLPEADRSWQGRAAEMADQVAGFLAESLGA